MPVHQLTDVTWEDAARLCRAGTVAILPMGALEAHGPHLPLGTDITIAEAMARAGADRLARRGYTALLMPPAVYAPAPFAAGFAGTVSVRAAATTTLVVDIAESLARHGIPALALANAHFDPAHVHAIREAVTQVRTRENPAIVFPDVTRSALAERLTDEFRSGACHAGQYETSILMAARADLVRDPVRRALPAVPISLTDAIRAGQSTFEEAGGSGAYFGAPAAATAEEGARTIDRLGTMLEEAVLEEYPHVA